ncbi:hypothetical protein [Anaerotruncus rubiinfantis]|uniref:hypothetical protein n=1 Tax=Anaerotruncus rubiinfantis TaxID=1720200 RepID=UPI0034A59577
MNVPNYADRLLEIHGPNMWNMFHVDRAIRFAQKYQLTGLIFHCNELLDKLVLPSKYFSKELSLARWPVRDATLMNNQYYLHGVLDKCKAAGLEFYAEVKELYYPAEILEVFPFLRKENGAACPTEPFWWEFVEEKFREFIELFPDVAGVIVSPGTRESMISLAANGCVCDRCKTYEIDRWYRELIGAMYRPLAAKGKRLVIRDFSYTKDHQYAMVEAAKAISPEIIMALKKTPHDYYPTFPDNPAVGNCGGMRQWIEFDCWGQYFGLGLFPCSVVEDMQGRLQRYLAKGASGVMLRTDWEILSQGSVFNSFNLLNLIAGAILGCDVNTDLGNIYRAWVAEGLFSPLLHDSFAQEPCVPQNPRAAEILGAFMKRSWQVLEKIIYVRGHVFQENVQLFDRVDMAYNMMIRFHCRDDWDPDASKLVEPTDENLAVIFQEKDEGVALAQSLREILKPEELRVSESIRFYLEFLLEMYELYARAFRSQAHTVFLLAKAQRTGVSKDVQAVRDTLCDYEDYIRTLQEKIQGKAYANEVEWALDAERLVKFCKDAERLIDAI